LLEITAEREGRRLADDRDDGLVVHPRVVEPVQEMDRAGPRCREADPDLAGELRVAARLERRELLVTALDEPDPVLRPVQRAEEAVDPVAGVAVDRADAPPVQAVEDEVGNGLRHLGLLPLVRSPPARAVAGPRPDGRTGALLRPSVVPSERDPAEERGLGLPGGEPRGLDDDRHVR